MNQIGRKAQHLYERAVGRNTSYIIQLKKACSNNNIPTNNAIRLRNGCCLRHSRRGLPFLTRLLNSTPFQAHLTNTLCITSERYVLVIHFGRLRDLFRFLGRWLSLFLCYRLGGRGPLITRVIERREEILGLQGQTKSSRVRVCIHSGVW